VDLNTTVVKKIIEHALAEDIGIGDLTSNLIFKNSNKQVSAGMIFKESGIVAGIELVKMLYLLLDPRVEVDLLVTDGERVKKGQVAAKITGEAKIILSGERVALNFLQRMSGIATRTNEYVKAVSGYPVKILDTRKTTPGLRVLEKYAVKVGGGLNHRFALYDGILIKDNHIKAAGSIGNAVEAVKMGSPPGIKIELEVETLEQVKEALDIGVDMILLDNMDIGTLKRAVKMIGNKAIKEASGGITLDNVREVAATGVDYISIGELTHSQRALDISLEIL